MILGFSTHAQSSGLDPWKNDSNELAKRGWVQWRHSFCATSCRIVREHAISRDGAIALFTHSMQPDRFSYVAIPKRG